MLSPVINAHANLADVDCMAAADPDACIAQLTEIAAPEPAPVATPTAESTSANSDAANTKTSKLTEPTKPATVKPQPTKPKKSTSTKPATSATNKSSTASSSTETAIATSAQPTTAASAEPSTVTTEQPTLAPTPKPVKHVVKKPQPHPATASTSPAVTLAGTPAPQPAPVVSASPTAQPTVTLAGTSATPAPQPKPPVYMTATSPEPVKPDLIADTMNCQKTPDPDQCVRNLTQKQGTPANFNPKNLPLNSDALGWSGPVKAALRYDSELSWILGLDYVQMLSESVGLSVKTGFGPNERRANITTGFAVTPDQHVKLTYEYLTQNLNFDFATGGVQEWVDQHAIGGAYQYLLRREILHSFEISGYTVRANSKDLSSIAYNPTTSGDQTTDYYVNYRRIAGGTENTIQAALNLLPMKNTALTVGGGFSNLSYDTQYEDNQATSTIAYQAHLTHLLTDKVKLTAGISSTASGTTHSAEIRHILPKDIELSLKGEYLTSNSLPNSSSITLGISYPAPKTYSIVPFGGLQELKNWIEKPVVYKTRVLAIKDEKNVHVQPTSNDFTQTIYTSNPVGQTTPDVTKIVPIRSTNMFTLGDPELTVVYQCSLDNSAFGDCKGAGNVLAPLNLVFDTPTGQSLQLYSTASVPAGEASSTSHSVVVKATATRPELPNPVVQESTLTLYVYSALPSLSDGNIDFDTTGGAEQATAPLTVTVEGLHQINDGIDLTSKLTSTGLPSDASFTFADPANPPTYWQILKSSGGDYYLLRNLDTQGRLNAQDIGSTSVQLCVYENKETSQCVMTSINVTVAANAVNTSTNAGSIHVDLPTPFRIQSGQTLPGWDFAPLAVSSLASQEVATSNAITIPITGDAYTAGSWTFDSLTPADWKDDLTPGFTGSVLVNNNSTTNITAPVIADETIYSGKFQVNSKANGGLVSTANTSFAVILTEGSVPMIWDTTAKSIRFDLTNGNQDPGLKILSGEQEIDLTAMVTDSVNHQVVTDATFSWAEPSDLLTANWQFIPCPSNTAHTCLFRATKTSGSSIILQAGDIGNTAPLICATSATLNSTNCQPELNFTVTADTHIRSNNQKYIQGLIPGNNPLRTLCSGDSLNVSLNPTTFNSYFVGQTLTLPGTAILITGDTFSNWTNLAVLENGGGWETGPTLNQGTGLLSGQVKQLSGTITYNGKYDFSVLSKAAGGTSLLYGNSKIFFYLKVINPCVE